MAYIGPEWVPDGTPGSTPGGPTGKQLAETTPRNPDLFMGFLPPFVQVQDKRTVPLGRRDEEWVDAEGRPIPLQIAHAWVAQSGRPAPVVTAQEDGTVSLDDMKLALDAYRDSVAKANTQYDSILGHEPKPTPAAVVSPVQATVDPTKVQALSPAERLRAALQQQTNVGSADLTGLRQSAQGQGAVSQLAAARLQQALRAGAAQASGIALGSTGAARKGAARAGVLAANQASLDAGAKAAELQAATTLQAQGQLAEIEQQRANLQAQLDQARAAGDQNAVNDITKKMADLDQRTQEFNASEKNKATARAEDQSFQAQDINNRTGLDVSRLTEEQRVANERLKLDASKAAQDAASGLLNENARQEQLAFAREQLRQAKDQADRQFWGQIISGLLSGAASVGAAAATTSDRRAKKDIEPVKDADLGELAQAVRKSLATWKYKQASDGPAGERAGPMAQDLEETRLGRAVVSERDDGTKQVDYGQLATLLAAATVKHRKREAR